MAPSIQINTDPKHPAPPMRADWDDMDRRNYPQEERERRMEEKRKEKEDSKDDGSVPDGPPSWSEMG